MNLHGYQFKPMLAGSVTTSAIYDIAYPCLVSPKLDGIRCIIIKGVARSRSLKPIPNEYVQRILKGLPDGFDGELMVDGVFNEVTSSIMKKSGEPSFTFRVFDWCTVDDIEFEERHERLIQACANFVQTPVKVVPHLQCTTQEEVMSLEKDFLSQGYEGICIRAPEGPYKRGRSTLKQGYLLKHKNFLDAEAQVIGVVPLKVNNNAPKKNLLGRTERSTAKAGMVDMPALGKFNVINKAGVEFDVGSGLDNAQREARWKMYQADPNSILGLWIKYKYQPPPTGHTDQKPRFPVFLEFRDKLDMSD